VGQRFRIGEIIHRYDVDVLIGEAVRSTFRPMRPNPLMPTFTAMVPPKEKFCVPNKYADLLEITLDGNRMEESA